jgi:hypothetical protein
MTLEKKITTSQTNLLSFPTFPRHIDTKSFAPQMSPAAADVTTKNRGFQTSQSLPSTALGHQKRPGDHPKKSPFSTTPALIRIQQETNDVHATTPNP